jgi:hypothetical protein
MVVAFWGALIYAFAGRDGGIAFRMAGTKVGLDFGNLSTVGVLCGKIP